MTYPQRLQYLSIPSFELRRLHLDLLFYYKIVFGLVDIFFLISLSFVLLMALEGMHINFLSHTVIVVHVVIILCRESCQSLEFIAADYQLCYTLLAFRQSIMGVDFSAFLKVFSSFVLSCHFVVGHFIAFTLDILYSFYNCCF